MCWFNVVKDKMVRKQVLPSPGGDELFRSCLPHVLMSLSDRPLAGMSCFAQAEYQFMIMEGSRPLAGLL